MLTLKRDLMFYGLNSDYGSSFIDLCQAGAVLPEPKSSSQAFRSNCLPGLQESSNEIPRPWNAKGTEGTRWVLVGKSLTLSLAPPRGVICQFSLHP